MNDEIIDTSVIYVFFPRSLERDVRGVRDDDVMCNEKYLYINDAICLDGRDRDDMVEGNSKLKDECGAIFYSQHFATERTVN